jgi:hypothetical protein
MSFPWLAVFVLLQSLQKYDKWTLHDNFTLQQSYTNWPEIAATVFQNRFFSGTINGRLGAHLGRLEEVATQKFRRPIREAAGFVQMATQFRLNDARMNWKSDHSSACQFKNVF